MKQLLLKNIHLIDNPQIGLTSLYTWLAKQKLYGKKSRERSRFLKYIEPRVKEISDERQKLLENYAEKDSEGKIIFKDKFGKDTTDKSKSVEFKLTEENQVKLSEAMKTYTEEPCKIDVIPERKDSVDTVKDVVLNTEAEFEGPTAMMYDEWCNAFESIRTVNEDGEEVKKENEG